MLTEGYCHLHRKILKYFTKPYSEINAWIWMITQAEWRNGDKYGMIITTTRQLALTWGINKGTVSRWLKKWTLDGRISCQFAEFHRSVGASSPHATRGATRSATTDATRVSAITLLNYDKYQTATEKCATKRATKGATKSAALLNTKKEVLKDKNLLVGDSRLPKKLQIELLKPGLKSDAEKYPNLNVPIEFEKWQNWMKIKGKTPKDYPASWRNWLIKAEEIRLEKQPKPRNSSSKRKEFGLD